MYETFSAVVHMTANIFHNIEVLLDCADSISRPIYPYRDTNGGRSATIADQPVQPTL